MERKYNEAHHFKGLGESESHNFDRDWQSAADRMGFKSPFGNALPYYEGHGSKGSYAHKKPRSGALGLAPPEMDTSSEAPSIMPTVPDPRAVGITNGIQG